MRVVALARVRGVVRSMLVVSLLLSAALSGVARAADAPLAAPLNDEKQARSLYARAEKSFDLGRFAEALTDYQAAYEAKPLPGFLFNIAQCYRNLSNFERARFFFRRYLALDPHASNHRRVEELIAEMTKQLDAQAAAPATAPPPVEPRPAAPSPSIAAPPAAAAPMLELAPPPGGSSSAPILSAKAPAPVEPARPVWRRWWFWTGVGVVVAGGVVAALLLTRPETRTPGSLDPLDGRAP